MKFLGNETSILKNKTFLTMYEFNPPKCVASDLYGAQCMNLFIKKTMSTNDVNCITIITFDALPNN